MDGRNKEETLAHNFNSNSTTNITDKRFFQEIGKMVLTSQRNFSTCKAGKVSFRFVWRTTYSISTKRKLYFTLLCVIQIGFSSPLFIHPNFRLLTCKWKRLKFLILFLVQTKTPTWNPSQSILTVVVCLVKIKTLF